LLCLFHALTSPRFYPIICKTAAPHAPKDKIAENDGTNCKKRTAFASKLAKHPAIYKLEEKKLQKVAKKY